MKNFKYLIKQNEVDVWTGNYPFQISFNFKNEQSLSTEDNQYVLESLCNMGFEFKSEKILTGQLHLEFKLKTGIFYRTEFSYYKIDDKFITSGTWYEVATNQSGEIEVIDSGDISDEFKSTTHTKDLFLVQMTNLFYKSLIVNAVDLESQLGDVKLIDSKILISQSVDLKNNSTINTLNFNGKLSQEDNKFRFMPINTSDNLKNYYDDLEIYGTFTLQNVQNEFKQTIAKFMNEILPKYDFELSNNFKLQLKNEYSTGFSVICDVNITNGTISFENFKHNKITFKFTKKSQNAQDLLQALNETIIKQWKTHQYSEFKTKMNKSGKTYDELLKDQ